MTAVLAIWNDCKPGCEKAYEVWYREEHLIERLSVPGFKVGRRYVALKAARKYLTTYEVDTANVLSSSAYHERLDNPTPRTADIMQNGFENMCRTICNRTDVRGAIRGAYSVTAAWSKSPLNIEKLTVLQDEESVVHSEIWKSAEGDSRKSTAEEALRGRDAKIVGCVILEFSSEYKARSAAVRLRKSAPEADVGVYQLLCELRAEDLP